MKKYIKSLLLVLFAGIALTACNDRDMGDITPVPAHEQLGNFQSYPTADATEESYRVSLSIGAEGDTICTIAAIDPTSGKCYYFTNGVCSYDTLSGVTTVEFAAADAPLYGGYPALAYLKRAHTGDYMIVQLFAVVNGSRVLQRNFSASFVKAFTLNNAVFYVDDNFMIGFDADGETVDALINNKAVPGKYTWDDTKGTGTLELSNGKTYALSVSTNNLLQLTAADGETLTLTCTATYN